MFKQILGGSPQDSSGIGWLTLRTMFFRTAQHYTAVPMSGRSACSVPHPVESGRVGVVEVLVNIFRDLQGPRRTERDQPGLKYLGFSRELLILFTAAVPWPKSFAG